MVRDWVSPAISAFMFYVNTNVLLVDQSWTYCFCYFFFLFLSNQIFLGNFFIIKAFLREAILKKSLLLFGHCQNRLDPPWPPVFLDTYEEIFVRTKKSRKGKFLMSKFKHKSASYVSKKTGGVKAVLTMSKYEQIFSLSCFP